MWSEGPYAIRVGGATPRPAVTARSPGGAPSALAQPEPRRIATSRHRGPKSTAPAAFHFMLATSVRVLFSGSASCDRCLRETPLGDEPRTA